jgi:predicted anti-sigma-YlaC factor YlaD
MHDGIDCTRVAQLLGDYLDGTLPREQSELLEWHLDGCRPCIAFVNTYKGTVNAAKKLRDVEIPPELKKRLVAFLRQSQPR